ncbi:MAG: Gmad2 immunoglobulin-like domain-containing protein [bacterium]
MKKTAIGVIIIVALILAGAGVLRNLKNRENGWVCENGQWVKRGNPNTSKPEGLCGVPAEDENKENENADETEEESNIIVSYPEPGDQVSFPFRVEGMARVFESTLMIELKDKNGNVIFDSFAMANSPDMGQFGPFEKEIDFLTNAPEKEDVVLEVFWYSPKDGSRLDMRSIPLKMTVGDVSKVEIFFSNDNFDPEISCNVVFPVERVVPAAENIAETAIGMLLKGLFRKEYNEGYRTNINAGVKFQKITIKNQIAYIDFNEELEAAVGGSCWVSAIRAQITQTLKQFSTIKDVVISINGKSEDILQP